MRLNVERQYREGGTSTHKPKPQNNSPGAPERLFYWIKYEYWDGYHSIQLVKWSLPMPTMPRKRFRWRIRSKKWKTDFSREANNAFGGNNAENRRRKKKFRNSDLPNSEVNNAFTQQRPARRFMSKCARKNLLNKIPMRTFGPTQKRKNYTRFSLKNPVFTIFQLRASIAFIVVKL